VDYETASVYQLVVVARDRGHDPLSAEAIVVIRVQDVNDNAPLITIRTLNSDVIGHLHSTALAQVIYHISSGLSTCFISSRLKKAFLLIDTGATTFSTLWVQFLSLGYNYPSIQKKIDRSM